MYQRKDGTWCDTLPRKGQSPKFFYGKTQAEVKRKIAAWRETDEKGISVSDALDEFLVFQEKRVRNGSYNSYHAPITRLKANFGALSLSELTPDKVQAFVKELAKRGYCRSYVSSHLSILNQTYDYQITKPYSSVKYNPCKSVKIPKDCVNKRRELPSEDAVHIIRSNLDHPFGLYMYFLCMTGLRRCEALALTDKDFSKGIIHVRNQFTVQGSKYVLSPPKTNAGVRDVVLLEPLKKALPKWKGYLFSPDGGEHPYTPYEFRKALEGYMLDVGLAYKEKVYKADGKHFKHVVKKRIVPHQLRHEFATICFDAELDSMDAAEMLGHSDDKVTKEIYTHIKETRREKTYQKLQDYVSKSY